MRNDNRTLRMRQVRRLRSGESRYLQEKDEKTGLSKREVRQVLPAGVPPVPSTYSSPTLFLALHFFDFFTFVCVRWSSKC